MNKLFKINRKFLQKEILFFTKIFFKIIKTFNDPKRDDPFLAAQDSRGRSPLLQGLSLQAVPKRYFHLQNEIARAIRRRALLSRKTVHLNF